MIPSPIPIPKYPDLRGPINNVQAMAEEQKWKIEVTLYRTEDGELELDHDADGVQGVGDIYALHRANQFYNALKEDSESLNEEGREIMDKARELNEELIGEIGKAVFQEEDGMNGES